jgi:ATP/ADP translocase
MKTRKKEEDYRTAHWLISPKMEWKKNGPLPFLYFFLGFGMSIIKNKPNTS